MIRFMFYIILSQVLFAGDSFGSYGNKLPELPKEMLQFNQQRTSFIKTKNGYQDKIISNLLNEQKILLINLNQVKKDKYLIKKYKTKIIVRKLKN